MKRDADSFDVMHRMEHTAEEGHMTRGGKSKVLVDVTARVTNATISRPPITMEKGSTAQIDGDKVSVKFADTDVIVRTEDERAGNKSGCIGATNAGFDVTGRATDAGVHVTDRATNAEVDVTGKATNTGLNNKLKSVFLDKTVLYKPRFAQKHGKVKIIDKGIARCTLLNFYCRKEAEVTQGSLKKAVGL